MQTIKEEVFVVLSEIIESLCLQKSKLDKTETDFPLNMSKVDIFFYNEISRAHVKLLLFRQICDLNVEAELVRSARACAYFENFFPKTMVQREFKLDGVHSVFFETGLQSDIIRKNFNPLASTEITYQEHERYFKFFDGSWEGISNKVDICQGRRAKKCKDVFVQTIPATADSQCQCNLLPSDRSTIILDEDPERKKIKLNSHCYTYMSYGKTHFPTPEFSQAGPEPLDIERNHSDRNISKKIVKSACHIRVGLSKRFKSRPMQN